MIALWYEANKVPKRPWRISLSKRGDQENIHLDKRVASVAKQAR